MAIFDLAHHAILLKIVYYGCALGGKTTNLITLHRLTDPDSRAGLVSIATKSDRTLFFDLLPMELGQIGGLTVRVKLYTVPGQVHYEVTRRQVLAGADAVVLVFDSDPKMQQANAWAVENLRDNLRRHRIDPKTLPTVLQWNKRDLPDARSVARLEAELNPSRLCAHESVATTGIGVVETFQSAVVRAIGAAYAKAGKKSPPMEELERVVSKALDPSKPQPAAAPAGGKATTFEHRFDSEAYRDGWAEKGRDRQIVDQETLLGEAVQTGMELAERLDGMQAVQDESGRRKAMIEALSRLADDLADPGGPSLPTELMTRLIEAASRSRGSLLIFQPKEKTMQEREIVPSGSDPLNQATAPSIGTAAFRLCHGETPRHVEDLRSEVFFNQSPPGAEDLVSCFIAPIFCDGLSFGALVAYSALGEPPFEAGEREFWGAASRWIGLSLHWRGMRRKLAGSAATAPKSG